MRIGKPALLFVFLLLFSSLIAAAQAKLEKIGSLSDASVPAAVRSAVESSGARLVRSDGSVSCEIWLRESLPATRAAAGSNDTDLAPSMLVGVIAFPNGGKDFRGQAIRPGFYTMRYELLPEDGNHLGVAPTRDFVLLLRANEDPDPNAQFDFAHLVKLSRQAAGTNHPAVFLLLAPEPSPAPSTSLTGGSRAPRAGGNVAGAAQGAGKDGASEARTYRNADGYQVFAGATRTESGKTVPIVLVVKGQAEQ